MPLHMSQLTLELCINRGRFAFENEHKFAINQPFANECDLTHKSDLKSVFIFGEVAPAKNGTSLSDAGDSNPQLGPLQDGDAVNSIISIFKPAGENPWLDMAYDCQTKAIHKYQDLINNSHPPSSRKVRDKQRIYFEHSFVRMQDEEHLIDIRIPKIRRRSGKGGNIVQWRDITKVVSNAEYNPDIMDHGCDPFFDYTTDVLVQPEVYDRHGLLIPPWLLQHELRPETQICAEVYLTARDTTSYVFGGEEFPSRTFEIWSKRIQILERGGIQMEQNIPPSGASCRAVHPPKKVQIESR